MSTPCMSVVIVQLHQLKCRIVLMYVMRELNSHHGICGLLRIGLFIAHITHE